MPLVTLAEAKKQLRVHEDDHDWNDDINMKVEQATDIIVDYLKSRAHKRFAIASSSVANPTVMTTDEAHGYANGDTVTISGHDDSAPAISGTYTVSNVTEFTFTIPVNVTVAGTGGEAVVEWTDQNVPGRVKSAVLLVLEDLWLHRPIDLESKSSTVRALLMRSRDPAYA